MARLVIGSRGSQLALWQARWVKSRLEGLGVEAEIEIIRTTGDKITDVPLAKVGSKGLFTKEIEDALLAGRVDLAVHSLKDLPTVLPAGLVLAAVPEREDPRDALVGKRLADLPQGARVGTSSLRRGAQLKRLRPDVSIESVRGNLDTRLRKLDEGQYEAILLAAAGLRRLGWVERIAECLDPDVMCPAVGQGALAIETRAEGEAREICARLDHEPTRRAVLEERAMLARLGGGCQVPIGAHAVVDGEKVRVRGVVASPDGTRVVSAETSDGESCAARLLEGGAREILREVYGSSMPLAGRRVVVTRAKEQSGELADRLRRLGAEVVELPVIALAPVENLEPLETALARLAEYRWAIFTSVNGVRWFFELAGERAQGLSGVRVAAVGPATAAALRERGIEPAVLPEEFVAESLVEALLNEAIDGARVLLPRAASARHVLPDALRMRGAVVDDVPVYRNIVPPELAEAAEALFSGAGRPDWVTLTSSSTVKNLLAAVGYERLSGMRLASIGPVTTATAIQHGLEIATEADPHTLDGLVDALVREG